MSVDKLIDYLESSKDYKKLIKKYTLYKKIEIFYNFLILLPIYFYVSVPDIIQLIYITFYALIIYYIFVFIYEIYSNDYKNTIYYKVSYQFLISTFNLLFLASIFKGSFLNVLSLFSYEITIIMLVIVTSNIFNLKYKESNGKLKRFTNIVFYILITGVSIYSILKINQEIYNLSIYDFSKLLVFIFIISLYILSVLNKVIYKNIDLSNTLKLLEKSDKIEIDKVAYIFGIALFITSLISTSYLIRNILYSIEVSDFDLYSSFGSLIAAFSTILVIFHKLDKEIKNIGSLSSVIQKEIKHNIDSVSKELIIYSSINILNINLLSAIFYSLEDEIIKEQNISLIIFTHYEKLVLLPIMKNSLLISNKVQIDPKNQQSIFEYEDSNLKFGILYINNFGRPIIIPYTIFDSYNEAFNKLINQINELSKNELKYKIIISNNDEDIINQIVSLQTV